MLIPEELEASVISEQVITFELCQFKKLLHHCVIELFKTKVGHHSVERVYSIITVVDMEETPADGSFLNLNC